MFILRMSLGSKYWVKTADTKNPLPVAWDIWKATNYVLRQENIFSGLEFLSLSDEDVGIETNPFVSKVLNSLINWISIKLFNF